MLTLNDFITREERLSAIRGGMLSKMAEHSIHPAIFKDYVSNSRLEKKADFNIKGLASGALENAIMLAVLAGIPLGVAHHYISEATNRKSVEEQKQLNKIKHYASKTNKVESDLAKVLK